LTVTFEPPPADNEGAVRTSASGKNSMPVTCPHCSTRYVLPQALLGPGGARVRCPRCREPFAVSAGGEAIAPAAAAKPKDSSLPAAAVPVNGTPPPVVANGTPAAGPAHAGPPRLEVKVPERETAAALIVEKGVAPETPSVVAAATGPAAPVIETPMTVARAVLDELAQHSGEAITASRDAGKLFREFGPVIAEAFEFYRRQVGPGADSAPFRAALREKWGVDLDPAHPAGRLG
jgi:predicted Zn finger-like uncharacterized protein